MKKIFKEYVLPIVAILGFTCGSYMWCKSKPVPEVDVPAKVEISNAYFDKFPAEDNNTGLICFYKENGDFQGYFSENIKDKFALEFRVKVHDPNMIRNVRQGWGKYDKDFSPEEEPKLEERSEITLSMAGPGVSWLEKTLYKVEVTDALGNVTKHEFTLDEITKQHKSYRVVRKAEGRCPNLKP